MALRSHLTNTDNLVKLHDSRLYLLERTFQEEVKKIEDDFNNEKEIILAKFKQEKRTLMTVLDAIEKEEEERESEVSLLFS